MLNYKQDSTFIIPSDIGHLEALPNGRILLIGVSRIMEETTKGSRTFNEVDAPDFGAPSYFKLSPSGKMAAVGNYQTSSVLIFPFPYVAGSTVKRVEISSFDAEWNDENTLGVSGSSASGASQISIIDVSSSDVKVVVDSIPGASGGVTFDDDGNLYTGIGADGGNPSTGLVKAFKNDQWKAVLGGVDPLDFASGGREVANLLSAAFLGFDYEGNLIVGGGAGVDDAGQPDSGYGAVVASAALRAALHDQPPIEPTSAELNFHLQKLDPASSGADPAEFWSVVSNSERKEIYLRNYYEATEVKVFSQHLLTAVHSVDVHLGDNPAAYPEYRFEGKAWSLALDIIGPDFIKGPVILRLKTKFVETLGLSHTVKFGSNIVWQMKDGYLSSQRETFDFMIPRTIYDEAVASPNNPKFSIELANPRPDLADDFIIEDVILVANPV